MNIALLALAIAATGSDALPDSAAPSSTYQLLSFADCGPPMPGGASCNADSSKIAPAIEALLARCEVTGVKPISATDGWIGYRFTAGKKAIECVRSSVPEGTQLELVTDTTN